MRWTVEAETARDVVSWPEELDDFSAVLRSEADNVSCDIDAVAGSVSARFEVDARRQEDAEAAARRVITEALERAGLRLPDEPLASLGVTPTRSVE